jgi:hypothetical protein
MSITEFIFTFIVSNVLISITIIFSYRTTLSIKFAFLKLSWCCLFCYALTARTVITFFIL